VGRVGIGPLVAPHSMSRSRRDSIAVEVVGVAIVMTMKRA
jgi:hypothetical protein